MLLKIVPLGYDIIPTLKKVRASFQLYSYEKFGKRFKHLCYLKMNVFDISH